MRKMMFVLTEIFGECPQIKIVETFAENYTERLYVSDIARITGITRITINNHINRLLDEGVIEKKNKVGKAQLYQLNMDNPKAKMILLLEKFITSEKLEKSVKEDYKNAV
jgi:DNA-binding transcriptional ArsR family regulator